MNTPQKPIPAGPVSSTGGRRSKVPSSATEGRNASPGRVLSAHGSGRSSKDPSVVARPNRASVRRPSSIVGSIGNIGLDAEDDGGEENARIENATLVDNLKKSLRNAEQVSENYQNQVAVMQKRMDDLMKEHGKLEEQFHESTKKVADLEGKRKEESRQVREMANLYESERMSMLRDREDSTVREEELKRTVQRLKETMAGREMRFNAGASSEGRRSSRQGIRIMLDVDLYSRSAGRTLSRSSSVDVTIDETTQFAPPSTLQRRESSHHRSESKSTSRLVMQKDLVIESLRLELAEAQIKLVEVENMGGNRVQELEKTLLETRMANARLMEDNESFQLLLGEKTLNGDITKTDLIQGSPINGTTGLSSLAEELESAEGESENYRCLESDIKSLKDQNKALTLYIEKIISRVLQHDNFENILDQKPEGLKAVKAKDEPPPPPPKDEISQPSMVQRAISVVGRRQRPTSQLIISNNVAQDENATLSKSRPQSQIYTAPPLPHTPTVNEDQSRAPSVPLGQTASFSTRNRPHRRTQSAQSVELTGAAAVVNQMYQGSGSNGPISPVSPGTAIPRSSYFNGTALASSTPVSTPPTNRSTSGLRSTSGTRVGASSDGESAFSREVTDAPSPPRNRDGSTVYTGAVMTQNKLRPLRLVQETREKEEEKNRRRSMATEEAEAARKKANRGSWMGWFNRGKDEPTPRSVSAGQSWQD